MLDLQAVDQARQVVQEFLDLMPLRLRASLYCADGLLEINISGHDRGYLLSDEGETLLSLQYILGRIIHQRIPDAGEIVLDCDGFLYRREQELRQLADRTVRRVRREGGPLVLPPMNPHDRRVLHTAISETDDLESFSEGDGFFKKIIVQSK